MKINNFLIFVILLVSLISLSNASGVASPYWDGNPLKIAPGESTTVTLSLQNMAGEPQDITVRASITSGSEIAKIIDDEDLTYQVPFGREDIPVSIKIEIPIDKPLGTINQIMVSFQQISTDEGGMLQVSSGFNAKIPVEIVGESQLPTPEQEAKKEQLPILIIILIILAILVLVALIVYLKKKKAANKKATKQTKSKY